MSHDDPSTLRASDFSALAASRFSTRDFLSDPVPEEILQEILSDATTAPSWSNTRPYKLALAVGENAERLRRLYTAEFERVIPLTHKSRRPLIKMILQGAVPDGDYGAWKTYPADLIPRSQAVGKALYTHLNIAREDREARDEAMRANFRAFNAPVIGLVLTHKKFPYMSQLDAGLMLQTLFLSAKAHGVDSCALGGLATWRRVAAQVFELPDNYGIITGFALGYASDAHVNSFRAQRPPIEMVPPRF
ncbi:MAG: nitroreductase family protein [Actinomycetaceae bacterium]|nr:nitroreductase family protein [Actinomycetaceae bacterium]